MNMSTVVYFDSGLLMYTCCYCCKHFLDLEHQMFLNPQLKIVPNKCAFLKTPVTLLKTIVPCCFRKWQRMKTHVVVGKSQSIERWSNPLSVLVIFFVHQWPIDWHKLDYEPEYDENFVFLDVLLQKVFKNTHYRNSQTWCNCVMDGMIVKIPFLLETLDLSHGPWGSLNPTF